MLSDDQNYSLTRETLQLYRSQVRPIFQEKAARHHLRFARLTIWFAVYTLGIWGTVYYINLIQTPIIPVWRA